MIGACRRSDASVLPVKALGGGWSTADLPASSLSDPHLKRLTSETV